LLIDTSALLRTLQVRHTQYETVARALETLPRRGYDLHLVPQNLFELWVVATRPVAQNGLGLSVPKATSELMRLKSMFTLLPDTPAIYPAWENLVIRYHVSGKPAHDARLVAAMRVHGLTSILTFDRTGFSRYAGIEVVHPADASIGALHFPSSAKGDPTGPSFCGPFNEEENSEFQAKNFDRVLGRLQILVRSLRRYYAVV
jgi:predicted nucleic acid-binding protein